MIGEFLNVSEVAAHFNVSRKTVLHWISAGRLRSVKLDGRTHVIPRAALADFYRVAPGRPRKSI